MSQDTIASIKLSLRAVLPEIASVADIADDADIVADIGLDSVQMLQFLLELEARLAIRIDFDRLDFDDLRSIRRLAACLARMPRDDSPSAE